MSVHRNLSTGSSGTSSALEQRILDILEWDRIIRDLERYCSTDPGRELARGLVPLLKKEIPRRLKKISELKDLLIQNIEPDFTGIHALSGFLELAGKGGTLKQADIFLIREFILASRRLRVFLNSHREFLPSWHADTKSLSPLKEPEERLVAAFTENGELNSSHFPELRRIREDIQHTRQEIEKSLNRMIHSPPMDKILQEKVYSSRNDRYVLLVKATMKHLVRGEALDVSSSGATIFMEPDTLRPMNNRLVSLMLDLQMETLRILAMLSRIVGKHAPDIDHNLSILADLDLHTAAARFSLAIRGCEPELLDKPALHLFSARHPLLYLMNPEGTVANDIFLGDDNTTLIISGANTGGKTVLLKTIGLCVLMVMHGLHIPAGADSRIGIFSNIMADIGDDQSLMQSLSSFSGQIVILAEMLKRANPSTLVLIDEIIVGTNPRQGAALAQAYIEELIKTGALIVISTHYAELKELAAVNTGIRNASVSFDLDSLLPTYRVSIGLPGVSYALEIARSYGMPETVIDSARHLLDSRELTVEALIEEMQRHEQEIAERRQALIEEQEQVARERELIRQKESTLNRLQEELKKERGLEFLEEIRSYRSRVAERIKNLQQSDMKTAGEIQKELKSAEEKIRQKLKSDTGKQYSDKYIPFDPASASTGSRVFIPSLEKEGIIESVNTHDKSVEILLGSSIRTRFRFEDLLFPSPGTTGGKRKSSAAKTKSLEPSGNITRQEGPALQTSYNTVDLRGMRVSEALDRMESDFDVMVRRGISTAIVIHGHGTGALKEAVRDSLSRSSYVQEFRPGKFGEGGDGVSVVSLRI